MKTRHSNRYFELCRLEASMKMRSLHQQNIGSLRQYSINGRVIHAVSHGQAFDIYSEVNCEKTILDQKRQEWEAQCCENGKRKKDAVSFEEFLKM